MAMHIVTSCTTDDSTRSLEDVRRLKKSLDRQRALTTDSPWTFSIITDYDRKTIREVLGERTKVIMVEREDAEDVFHDPSFYLVYAFNNYNFNSEDKVVYLDANVVVKNPVISLLYDGLPDRGDCQHASIDTLTFEQRERIEAENLPAIYQCEDWTGKGDTKYFPHFMMFHYGQNAELTDFMMMENIEEIQKYPTFQHMLEDKFVGEFIRTQAGAVGPYRVNDEDYNQDLIHAYEKNVRPHFANDEYGCPGGEEEELYISIDHHYRDMARQTRMVYLDRPDNVKPEEDYFLELYII